MRFIKKHGNGTTSDVKVNKANWKNKGNPRSSKKDAHTWRLKSKACRRLTRE